MGMTDVSCSTEAPYNFLGLDHGAAARRKWINQKKGLSPYHLKAAHNKGKQVPGGEACWRHAKL